jgi:hypothetical protein
MHRHLQVISLVAAFFLASSCSDMDARSELTQPSFVGGSFVAVTATSSTTFAQPVNNPICPSIAPFNVGFGIVVRASGSSNVIIQLRFTDASGVQSPQITLPMPAVTTAAPNPTALFGSSLVPAGSGTTVPMNLPIGCGTGSQGTILIIIDTSDDRGHRTSQQVQVTVR